MCYLFEKLSVYVCLVFIQKKKKLGINLQLKHNSLVLLLYRHRKNRTTQTDPNPIEKIMDGKTMRNLINI